MTTFNDAYVVERRRQRTAELGAIAAFLAADREQGVCLAGADRAKIIARGTEIIYWLDATDEHVKEPIDA